MLGTPAGCYRGTPQNQKNDSIRRIFIKATNIIWDLDGEDNVSLPTQIDIPDGMEDEEEISDYLSEVTGFCHKGFSICCSCVRQRTK